MGAYGSQVELDQFATQMLKLFRFSVRKKASGISLAVRILGYISVDNAKFEAWLLDNLSPRFTDSGAVKHSFGLCVRNPENIAQYLYRLFKPGAPMPKTNDMKGVSQILRYRAKATELLTAKTSNLVLEKTIDVFERELKGGGSSYNFRWSSLVIVFLLRRRMFDSDFADSDGHLAMRAKTLFEEAIKSCRSGRVRPLGGSVDVPAALQQMINYIDKKGRGDILMSND